MSKKEKGVHVNGFTRKAGNPIEMKVNDRKAVEERWRRYYASKKN